MAVFAAVCNVVAQLAWTVLVCRLLPKLRPPVDLPLHSWRAQLAALKLRLVAKSSEALGDASVQATFLRLCGASIGPGSSMSEQVMLPETVEVGRGCFFASGNVLTSLTVDQGRLRMPSRTQIGDGAFLGNTNHIAEGLPAGGFCGLHTWLPRVPREDQEGRAGNAFFGNPAMRFIRSRAGQTDMGGAPGAVGRWRVAWYHFSTSVLDVFFWDALKALEFAVALILGQLLLPLADDALEQLALPIVYTAVSMLAWYLVHVCICNLIYNDRAPTSNPFYSTVVTCWFNANKARRVFKSPLRTPGTVWHAALLRAIGGKVGRRFFSAKDDVLIDPPFARLGDDVTIDYDAQVRQHSFEDMCLKWGPNWVGRGTTILQGGCLAMTDTGEGVTLRPGSVTWKGQLLEAGQEYEGTPAAVVGDTRV